MYICKVLSANGNTFEAEPVFFYRRRTFCHWHIIFVSHFYYAIYIVCILCTITNKALSRSNSKITLIKFFLQLSWSLSFYPYARKSSTVSIGTGAIMYQDKLTFITPKVNVSRQISFKKRQIHQENLNRQHRNRCNNVPGYS